MKAGMSFKTYVESAGDFAFDPFAAYQFTLVQKVFESIPKRAPPACICLRGNALP